MNTKLQFYLLTLAMIVQMSLCAQTSNTSAQRWKDFKNDFVKKECQMSVFLMNTASGEVILEDRAEENFIPASTMKILTTATALEKLGENYTWETGVYLVEGVKGQNLAISCSGDPSFGSNVFANGNTPEKVISLLLNEVLNSGVKGFWRGDVVLHPNKFKNDWLTGGTAWEDVANYYGGQAGAFQFNDNQYELEFQSTEVGEEVKLIRVQPALAKLSFINKVKAATSSKDNAYIYGLPESAERFVRGEIPHRKSTFSIKGALPSGTMLLESMLREALGEVGIQWDGTVRWKEEQDSTLDEKNRLLSISSAPLKDLVQHTLKKSDNLYANAILLTLGVELKQEGSFEAGTAVLKDYCSTLSATKTSKLRIKDGSGLSRTNGISAKTLALMLAQASPKNQQILEAGMKLMDNKHSLRYKSGYLDGVRCYAGYLEHDGNIWTYAIMANGIQGSSRAMANSMLSFIAGFE